MTRHETIHEQTTAAAEYHAYTLEIELKRDGQYTPIERALVAQAKQVYALSEKANRCVYAGLRIVNGGRADRGLLGQVKEADELVQSILFPPEISEGSRVQGESLLSE